MPNREKFSGILIVCLVAAGAYFWFHTNKKTGPASISSTDAPRDSLEPPPLPTPIPIQAVADPELNIASGAHCLSQLGDFKFRTWLQSAKPMRRTRSTANRMETVEWRVEASETDTAAAPTGTWWWSSYEKGTDGNLTLLEEGVYAGQSRLPVSDHEVVVLSSPRTPGLIVETLDSKPSQITQLDRNLHCTADESAQLSCRCQER